MSTERVMRRHVSKKGSGKRTWLVMDKEGEREVVEAGRPVIMRRTGLAARDLRVLDPMLSYPSTIVGRDRAMVVNLEHIKAIITAHDLLLLNSKDPSVIPFIDHLHQRILHHQHATHPHPQEGQDGKDKGGTRQDSSMKILPFEFVALEACLEAVCSALENEANVLEQEAHPALDQLTSKITALNLERVRHVKSRLVALTARVQRVRDELENLLDDDGDMAELYLTDKLVQQQHDNSSSASSSMNDSMLNRVLQPHVNDRNPSEVSMEHGGGDSTSDDHKDRENVADYPSDQICGASNGVSSEIHEAHDGTTTYTAVTNKSLNVEELEMLLGAYFVQIGGTLNKLYTLRDYVDDTEDYINITLDDKQNRILQTGVRIGTASVLLNAFVAVTGVFGMNIHVGIYDTGISQFLATIFGCTAACAILYVVAMAWYKHKRILE